MCDHTGLQVGLATEGRHEAITPCRAASCTRERPASCSRCRRTHLQRPPASRQQQGHGHGRRSGWQQQDGQQQDGELPSCGRVGAARWGTPRGRRAVAARPALGPAVQARCGPQPSRGPPRWPTAHALASQLRLLCRMHLARGQRPSTSLPWPADLGELVVASNSRLDRPIGWGRMPEGGDGCQDQSSTCEVVPVSAPAF